MYHYSKFPNLSKDLFGKLRVPRKLDTEKDGDSVSSRVSVLRQRRSVYGFSNGNVDVQRAKLFRPKKSFGTAMKTLAAPFKGRKVGMTISPIDGTSHSVSSELSFGNPFESAGGDIADEFIADIERRRQIILVGIITKFQAACRAYLTRSRRIRREHGREMLRSRSKSGVISHDVAALVIQARYRSKVQRTRLRRMRSAVRRVSAFHKGNWVRTLFRTIRTAVVRTQAKIRGVLTRRRFYGLLVQRMELFRRHMFSLWQLLDTPLLYRSVFWSYLHVRKPCKGFVRLALAEEELLRLWKSLNPHSASTQDFEGSLGDRNWQKSLRNDTFNKCLAIQRILEDSGTMKESILKPSNGMAKSAAGCVLAERTQLYEKLSKMSESESDVVFGRFSISHSEKKRKVTIVQSICTFVDQAIHHLTSSKGNLIKTLTDLPTW